MALEWEDEIKKDKNDIGSNSLEKDLSIILIHYILFHIITVKLHLKLPHLIHPDLNLENFSDILIKIHILKFDAWCHIQKIPILDKLKFSTTLFTMVTLKQINGFP
jgi:hypothetical protein